MTDANPSDSGGRQDTCIDLEKKVEALIRELSEARERETATSEVLRVIASSPNDVQPVFNTIVTSAARLRLPSWRRPCCERRLQPRVVSCNCSTAARKGAMPASTCRSIVAMAASRASIWLR